MSAYSPPSPATIGRCRRAEPISQAAATARTRRSGRLRDRDPRGVAGSAVGLARDSQARHRADVGGVRLLEPRFLADRLHAVGRQVARALGAADVDVLGPLADLGQHVDAVRQDLAEAPEAGQVARERALAVLDLARAQHGEERGVPGQHAEVAVLSGGHHLVHLLAQQEAFRRHHLEDHPRGQGHRGFAYSWNFLAASNTSSMAPCRKNACSGTWSSSPFTIILKLRMLSASETYL